ncbi:MAG: type II secretion system F family protein [Thermoleophilia bacterium]
MPHFAYNAINAQGIELSGEIQAADMSAARDALRGNGLLAEVISEQLGRVRTVKKPGFFDKKVSPKSLQVFSRQFATMIEAGLSVVSALVILEEQSDDPPLKLVIANVREEVETGAVLSEAMALHPEVFSRLFVAMVEAGEAAGVLDTVLDRVAVQIEKEQRIKRRIRGAMIYPAVVVTFAGLVMTGMLMFLVPVFVKIFDQLGGDLPLLTQYVLKASNALRYPWFPGVPIPGVVFIFGGLGTAFWYFRRWKKTDGGRAKWDAFKLRIPMQIGGVVLKVSMARWSRTLATLIASGVDIMRALEITAQTSGNWVVEKETIDLRLRVEEGTAIATPLIESDIFPPMIAQMVKIGEETGELEKMLSKVADFYEDEVDASVQALTSIIEPMMMIGVGAMVGVIIISMYLPMFKLLTLVK